MNFIKTDIDGVVIIEPRIFTDSRGYFFESYNEAEFIKNGITNRFVQDNQSKSSYGDFNFKLIDSVSAKTDFPFERNKIEF